MPFLKCYNCICFKILIESIPNEAVYCFKSAYIISLLSQISSLVEFMRESLSIVFIRNLIFTMLIPFIGAIGETKAFVKTIIG